MKEVLELNKDRFDVATNKLDSLLNGKFVLGYLDGDVVYTYFGSEITDMEVCYLIDSLDKIRETDDLE